jgi:hypothetical protein
MEELTIALIIGGWIVTGIAFPLLVIHIRKQQKKREKEKPETWHAIYDDGTIIGTAMSEIGSIVIQKILVKKKINGSSLQTL